MPAKRIYYKICVERKGKIMMKRILSINMNDLGGRTNHLMNHRYFNNRDKKYHIDWKNWAMLDKTETWEKMKEYILAKKPDILIVEEMIVCHYETTDYIRELEEMGYSYVEESLPERGDFSLTMMFYREVSPEHVNSPGNYREYRSVVCKVGDLLICGSHFPSESDKVFLKHMFEFSTANLGGDFLLIGDLNANDPARGNKKIVNDLVDAGAVDLWTAAGNDKNTPTEAKFQGRLDYAIASPSLSRKVQNIEIDPFPMVAEITDHAAVIVDMAI